MLSAMSLFRLFAGSPVQSNPDCVRKKETLQIMEAVKPYFLSAYGEGFKRDKKTKVIQGKVYSVERANHGLAHSLRQGALAKDLFSLLIRYPITDSSGIVAWARRKQAVDPKWGQKLQIAASYQRSGRQSECSSSSHPHLYKKYEMQDTIHFQRDAGKFPAFANMEERRMFAEAILWSNSGKLNEDKLEDLKYVRRILHAAHILDLRRIRSFSGSKILQDAMNQLFEKDLPPESPALKQLLWDRSGTYLEATGDRDLVSGRNYQDQFFIQSQKPLLLVDAICRVSSRRFLNLSL
jgi:hypothetical protein